MQIEIIKNKFFLRLIPKFKTTRYVGVLMPSDMSIHYTEQCHFNLKGTFSGKQFLDYHFK
jgi:hypothetical protein